MAKKIYGVDGPPQLQGVCKPASHALRQEWAKASESDGGEDSPWFLTDPSWQDDAWSGQLQCPQCVEGAFKVKCADEQTPKWISGELAGFMRVRLFCTHCEDNILFFDDGLHGYNAVVCEDNKTLPEDYLNKNDAVLSSKVCECGGTDFEVIAFAMYDSDEEDLEEIPENQWDDTYGTFASVCQCIKCHKIEELISAETA